MYITGSYSNFENRLHSLPTGVADLNTFKLEGQSYTGVMSTGIGNPSATSFENKWNKEFVKKAANYGIITGNVFS